MKRRRDAMRWIGAAVLLGVGTVTVASCAGGEFSTATNSCADEVDSCPQDEVCWPTTDGFGCLPAPTSGGTEGAQCENTLGRPTCAHGFVCYDDADADPPVHQCSPRCDPPDSSPCSNTAKDCVMIRFSELDNITIGVCQP